LDFENFVSLIFKELIIELKVKIDYNQILGLIHQLPRKEIEKLAFTLQSEVSSKKSHYTIREMILKAPTWSGSDFNNYQEARNHIDKSRIA
jgi:hypothetical protein